MPKPVPRKALISISSFNGAIYPTGGKTGLFFTEALHPFEVLTEAGFEVDLASETGTFGFDDVSLTDHFCPAATKRFSTIPSIHLWSNSNRNSRKPPI
jgi:D-lactate dehydratase